MSLEHSGQNCVKERGGALAYLTQQPGFYSWITVPTEVEWTYLALCPLFGQGGGCCKPTCHVRDLLPSLVSHTNLPYRYQLLVQVLVTPLTMASGIAGHSFYAQGQTAFCSFCLSDERLWHEPEPGPPRNPGQQYEEDTTTPFVQGEWLVTTPPLLPGNNLDHLSGHVHCHLWDLHTLSTN